mgnify:CR=1 FL=1
MFFRRQQPREYSLSERLSMMREKGFRLQEETETKVVAIRDGFAAVVHLPAGQAPWLGPAGLLVGPEIAQLVQLGYQAIWRAPSGGEQPATARQLKTHHDFLEDLRDAIELPTLYNEGLGTVSARHEYDRVRGRG